MSSLSPGAGNGWRNWPKLTAAYGVQATAVPLDLSRPAAGQTLAEEVAQRGLTVTSVVNNGGFGTFGPFHTEDPGRLQ